MIAIELHSSHNSHTNSMLIINQYKQMLNSYVEQLLSVWKKNIFEED